MNGRPEPNRGDAKKLLGDEIDRARKQAQEEGRHFTPLPQQEFVRDLNKPLVLWQAWTPGPKIGTTLIYRLGVANPTAKPFAWVFAHVFVGPANIGVDLVPRGIAEALSAVDSRFPRLSLPQFPGLLLESSAIDTLTFTLEIPENVQRGNYLGNCFLFQSTWHNPGEYLDRSLFVFEVV